MILYDSPWKNLVFNEGVATAMATAFSLGPRVSLLTGSLKEFDRGLE